jgi:hypothetical protein
VGGVCACERERECVCERDVRGVCVPIIVCGSVRICMCKLVYVFMTGNACLPCDVVFMFLCVICVCNAA